MALPSSKHLQVTHMKSVFSKQIENNFEGLFQIESRGSKCQSEQLQVMEQTEAVENHIMCHIMTHYGHTMVT